MTRKHENASTPTLTEAIDTLLAEVFSPLQDAGPFQTHTGEWKSKHSYEACVGVLENHGWHTLEERQPADGEYCLLTLKILGSFDPPVPASVFEYNTGNFYREGDDGQDYERPQKDIIAWMPLPQPYRKES